MGLLNLSKSTFKPILIHTDENIIHRKTAEARLKEPLFQKIVFEAESFLNRKLTIDEKKQVIKGKMPVVYTLLKKQMNLPNADTTYILNLHRTDESRLRKAFNEIFRMNLLDLDLYEITEKEFKFTKEGVAAIEKLAQYHTRSEKGNQAFKVANRLMEIFNSGFENGLISEYAADDFTSALKGLLIPKRSIDRKGKVAIDYEGISRIK